MRQNQTSFYISSERAEHLAPCKGATYVDLNDLERGEFTATGDMTAGPDNWYVAKDDVHYNLWNLLIGVQEPERLGTTRE